jgi:hypothetical protein
VETELHFIALSDPLLLFNRTAKGGRTFTLREIHQMPESMRRCIASIKVRTENLDSGDGTRSSTSTSRSLTGNGRFWVSTEV